MDNYKPMRRHALPGLVLLLAAVVSISGCTTPTLQTGNGVVIQEFTPSLSEVYPGEPVIFFLKFKNIGSVEASKAFAELVGLDEDWAAASKDINGNKVSSSGELFPREAVCRHDGNGIILSPPDMTYGTEGETATCTWIYKVPPIPGGFDVTYDIKARVFYDYRTELLKSFTILSTGELMRYNQQGKAVPSSTVSSTNSPVTITAEARDPIRFCDKSSVTFPIAITFSNTGGGMVCLKGKCKKPDHEWNQLAFSVKGMVFEGQDVGVEVNCFGRDKIEVWPNRDNTIVCDVTVNDISQITGQEERLISISATYSYFTESGASITVL
jgi:hypothetical protein